MLANTNLTNVVNNPDKLCEEKRDAHQVMEEEDGRCWRTLRSSMSFTPMPFETPTGDSRAVPAERPLALRFASSGGYFDVFLSLSEYMRLFAGKNSLRRPLKPI